MLYTCFTTEPESLAPFRFQRLIKHMPQGYPAMEDDHEEQS